VKALTIRQPWAGAIVHQTKRVENRSWKLPAAHIGTRILIHAGAERDKDAIVYGPNLDGYGAIVGVATFTGCHFDSGRLPCCSEWAFTGTYHWQIANVIALPEPVPAKGSQRFWTPTPAVLAAVQQQLPEHALT
jgi:hypothetical protein